MFPYTPEDMQRTADGTASAYVTFMEELGHFPISKFMAKFREYLLSVLGDIKVAPSTN